MVRWQSTKRETAAHNADYFARGGKLAGIALTVVDEAKTPRYGAYGHYSGEYYNKYYQS